MAMYPVFLNAEDLCMKLGACAQKSLVALPTCDECTGSVAAIADMISSEETINEVVAFLQVKSFNFITICKISKILEILIIKAHETLS